MEELDYMAIGTRLRQLRIERGKTIAEVSGDTGLGISAIANYENGLRIPRDLAKIKLAHYYGKSVEELFFTKDETQSMTSPVCEE